LFGVVHGVAHVGAHRDELVLCRIRLGEHDVDGGAHDGEWRAQFMARIGDELPLAGERPIEASEHVVEGVGEFTQLVARALQGKALGQVLLTGGASSRGELMDRSQDPGDNPPGDRREDGDAAEREQRVQEQVFQGVAACASQTCSSTSSALTVAPSAPARHSRTPNSFRVRPSGCPARVAR
jgi:hypothetical protein